MAECTKFLRNVENKPSDTTQKVSRLHYMPVKTLILAYSNNNNNNNIYLLQLGCYPVAVVILHVNKHEIGYY